MDGVSLGKKKCLKRTSITKIFLTIGEETLAFRTYPRAREGMSLFPLILLWQYLHALFKGMPEMSQFQNIFFQGVLRNSLKLAIIPLKRLEWLKRNRKSPTLSDMLSIHPVHKKMKRIQSLWAAQFLDRSGNQAKSGNSLNREKTTRKSGTPALHPSHYS